MNREKAKISYLQTFPVLRYGNQKLAFCEISSKSMYDIIGLTQEYAIDIIQKKLHNFVCINIYQELIQNFLPGGKLDWGGNSKHGTVFIYIN